MLVLELGTCGGVGRSGALRMCIVECGLGSAVLNHGWRMYVVDFVGLLVFLVELLVFLVVAVVVRGLVLVFLVVAVVVRGLVLCGIDSLLRALLCSAFSCTTVRP